MATLQDVAKLCGVSTATVSNVLNSRAGRVSAETRQKVLAAVRELKYRPTALEKNQKATLALNLGVMVTDITKNPLSRHGYFREVLDGILEGAMFRGWSITIFAEKLWDDVGVAVRRSYDGRCDGLIVIAPTVGSETVTVLQERGTPLMLVGTTATMPGISSVDIDNVQATDLITKHFLDLGHCRFCFMGNRRRVLAALERERAFRTALRAAEIPSDHLESNWVRDGGKSLEDYLRQWKKRGSDRPTAFYMWNDAEALSFLKAAKELGISIPRDLSIASIDDCPEASTSVPALTSVPQPLHLIGRRAATLMIDRLTEPNVPDEVVRFSVELTARESSGVAPKVSSPALATT